MKFTIHASIFSFLFSSPILAETRFAWSNPLPFNYSDGQTELRREIRDPCVIRVGDTWHLVFTMWPFRNREEEKLMEPDKGGSPGIAMYSSKDLKEWKFQNWLVKSSDLPESSPYKNRFWAPEIHRIGGKFYLIFTADNWNRKEYHPAGTWGTAGYAFVGVSENVNGPYEHITWIEGAACDTSLFEDVDGKTYPVIPRHNIDMQEIDLSEIRHAKVRLLGQPKTIIRTDSSDIGMRANPAYLEGPWAERIDGKIHIFYAAFHKDPDFPEWLGYHTGVATADTALGSYRKATREKNFSGGHLSVFVGPDNRKWFCYRGESENKARGLLAIDPFEINPNGKVGTQGPTVGPRP